jgi:hypothetical protein
VSKVSGAVRYMELCEEERDTMQILASTNDDHRVCETVVFDRRGSPMIGGLGASCLGRFGRAICETTELCLELAVNAPSETMEWARKSGDTG